MRETRRRIENVLSFIHDSLDTSHFEMSELNATAVSNAAESKKRKKERRKEEK